jgi:hypothetical protein
MCHSWQWFLHTLTEQQGVSSPPFDCLIATGLLTYSMHETFIPYTSFGLAPVILFLARIDSLSTYRGRDEIG